MLNNRILLRDTLLNEKDYSFLKYQEDKILLTPNYYNNFIIDHLNNIRLNNIKIKFKHQLEKIYEKSKYKNPKLILKPIIIEFKKIFSFVNNINKENNDDEKEQNKDEKQIFEIPFEFTPVFYSYNFSKIKVILSSIFYLDNDFNTFQPNFKNFSYLIENYLDYKQTKSEKQEIKRNDNKKMQTTKIKPWNSVSIKKDRLKLINVFNNEYNYNEFYESSSLLGEKEKSQSSVNFFSKNKNKIYFSNKNIFEYIWLTPDYEYLVTIKTPEISFFINDIELKKILILNLFFSF